MPSSRRRPSSIAYTSSTYSWTASPANPALYTVQGQDTLGNPVDTPLSFASDTAGPTGGSLTLNATSASTGRAAQPGRGDLTALDRRPGWRRSTAGNSLSKAARLVPGHKKFELL